MKNSKSIVVFGSESSGKSTLSQELSSHYKVFFNPEFSRTYLDLKIKYAEYSDTHSLNFQDVEPITIGQLASEKQTQFLAQKYQHSFYILDTNLLTTYVYSKYIYNQTPSWLKKAIAEQNYFVYLLLKPNIKWKFDVHREGERERLFFYDKMKKELQNFGHKYFEISALGNERKKEAIKIIDALDFDDNAK